MTVAVTMMVLVILPMAMPTRSTVMEGLLVYAPSMAMPTTPITPTRIVTSIPTIVLTLVEMMCTLSLPTTPVMGIGTQATAMQIAHWVTTAVKRSDLAT